jgi:hypothetical protein
MYEGLKLKLTKDGVQVQNQAVIISTRTAAFDYKSFNLDNDFWLILK